MADKKITDLTAAASSVATDVYPVVVDVPTVPITKKITMANLIASIAAILKVDDLVHGDDNTDLNATSSYHGLLPKLSDHSYGFLNGKGAYDENLADGWINPDEIWTYASATSFTVPGDQTAKYQPGLKVKWTQTTVKYGHVASSSYGAPNTTVNLIAKADYSVANAAISANYYSRVDRPQGFPDWFVYVPGLTGWSSAPAVGIYTYRVSGRKMEVNVQQSGAATSNTTTVVITAPMAAADRTNDIWGVALWSTQDNGSYLAIPGRAYIQAGSANITCNKDHAGAAWTNSGTKTVGFTLIFEI